MNQPQGNKTLSTLRSVGLIILIFILVNFLFETIITIIESQAAISLYGIFPFTRIALLIGTIFVFRSYRRNKQAAKEAKR